MNIFLNNEGSHCNLLPFHMITAGNDPSQPPRYRPEGARFHHIFFIEKGAGIFETRDGQQLLPENTIIFIRKNYPINYYKSGDTFQTAWVTFDGPFVEPMLQYFHMEPFAYCPGAHTPSFLTQCIHLAKKGSSPEQLSLALYELLIAVFAEIRKPAASPHLDKAKHFIEEHYMQDISVEDVSAAAGISSSFLYRLFREEEHTTPVTYLQRIRIRNAKQLLLQHPEKKISEIAAMVGYSDCAYFCKVFKSQGNLSPKAFLATYSL